VNPTPEIPSPPAQLPPRPARVAALRALMGRPDVAVRPFADAIRAVSHRSFDRHVVPLARAHWPAVLHTPFFEKLRIGACDLYASGPYTALFCAPRAPAAGAPRHRRGQRPPAAALGPRAASGASPCAAPRALAYADQHRRIALVAAFIVVVDHALDHVMTDPPEPAARASKAVLEGASAPDHPGLALARALASPWPTASTRADRAPSRPAMDGCTGWIRAEVRAMRGEPDPEGLGHRRAGVEGTIDGLLFPVVRFAAKGRAAWMYDVSMFVQLMDDWIDVEADARSDRDDPDGHRRVDLRRRHRAAGPHGRGRGIAGAGRGAALAALPSPSCASRTCS
jgi:hypothetical protein